MGEQSKTNIFCKLCEHSIDNHNQPEKGSDDVLWCERCRTEGKDCKISKTEKEPIDIEPEVVSSISPAQTDQLKEYKILFNPVRLAIVKALYNLSKITSSQLREILDVKWGTLTSNIRTLQEASFLETNHEFIDESVKKVITLTHMGEKKYEEFTYLITNLLGLK